ncbi:MAG: hypothetical protein N2Z74_03325 [Syntrophales bacterium]|nr:hypothetical protein [Syntrophales bacterium]
MKKDSYEEVTCRYFARPGSGNTSAVVEAAVRVAEERGIDTILVASCTGKTALKALKAVGETGKKLVVVTHVTGFVRADHQEMTPAVRKRLEGAGVRVLTASHAFGGVGRAVRKKLGTYQVDEIMAYTLRVFGQGTKVAVEIALMAADAGLVRTDRDVISIGGTEAGADTALIVRPAHSANFFDLKVREILCKPRDF